MSNTHTIGERVSFLLNYNTFVGTIVQALNNGLYVIQTGFDKEKSVPQYQIIDGSSLVTANQQQVDEVGDYRQLVSKDFHVGSKLRPNGNATIESIGKISGIEIKHVILSTNALLDIFEVIFYGEKGNLIDKVTKTVLQRDYVVDNGDETIEEDILDMLNEEEEINDVVLEPGIRVKVRTPYYFNGHEIVDLIGVIYELDHVKKKATLWFNTDAYEEIKEEFDFDQISFATLKEINSIPYKQIVDPDYYIGNSFKAKREVEDVFDIGKELKENDVVTIVGIDSLSHIVTQDTFIVETQSNEKFSLSAYALHTFFETTFDGVKPELNQQEEQLKKVVSENERDAFKGFFDKLEETKEVNVDSEDYDGVVIHSLSINNFTFRITDEGNVECDNEISKSDLNSYIQALQKLQRVIK